MDRKDVEVMTCCCKGNEDGNVKHKQRDEQEKKALMTRLSRIEGQVRGIRAMFRRISAKEMKRQSMNCVNF